MSETIQKKMKYFKKIELIVNGIHFCIVDEPETSHNHSAKDKTIDTRAS